MKPRSGCSSFALLIFFGLLAAFALLAFIAASTLTARAEENFGPPAPSLDPLRRAQLGIQLGWRAQTLLRPVDESSPPQEFEIAENEPTFAIVSRLQTAGLIREADLFSDYLVYTGLDRQLQSGAFELSPAMNAAEIAQALLDPTPGEVTLSILPGWRLEEIAATLPTSGLAITPEAFLAAARTPAPHLPLPPGLPPGAGLEGYLLPANYEVERETDLSGLLRLLLDSSATQLDADLLAGFEAQGLSLHQALTLASIVEREAVIDSEMGLIASVFLNRLAAGMKLEADPTVQYALGYDAGSQTWWTRPLLLGHLSVDSPYNTYLYAGLPPGPIASPSLEALRAVAFPTASDYFYFQAACDGSGSHLFALTFEEHLGNNCP